MPVQGNLDSQSNQTLLKSFIFAAETVECMVNCRDIYCMSLAELEICPRDDLCYAMK